MILGIEIGGTKLQLAVGSGESVEITEAIRLDVCRHAGAKGILEQIKPNAARLIDNHKIDSIGIGFGGPVDTQTSTTIISHQIAGWDNFQLGKWCETEFGIKAAIDNDCNVAALAEAHLGAGRGYRRVFYVTVGTGIGGGLVVDGNIYGGDRLAAAEIGHLRPGLFATDPRQTVESFSSGSGIEHRTRERLHAAGQDSDAAELLALGDRNIEKLDEIGRPDLAERARALEHLLPPKPTGAMAAIAASPGSDVAFVGHLGLERLSTLRDLWRGIPMDSHVVARVWRVAREEIPPPPEQETWLYEHWETIDTWIDDTLVREAVVEPDAAR